MSDQAPSPRPVPLSPVLYRSIIEEALREDLGRVGDVTTDAIVSPSRRASGTIAARRAGRVAGLEVALSAFRHLDPTVEVEIVVPDGADAEAGSALARVRGRARELLTAERTALNVLGRLCGIATTTRALARSIAHTRACVVCTRKTTPLLRCLEKYAVRVGGGANHRFGLDDAVLIKDNHRVLAGGAAAAVELARRRTGHLVKIEVEVDDLEEIEALMELGVDAVLLDNMSPETLRQAVDRIAGRAITEASGGITPRTAPAIAESGVDLLSVGWLTHSAPVLDVGFDLEL